MKNVLEFKAYRDMDKMDGVDHIRIDRHGITPLGRQLTIGFTRAFYHPEYGSFGSIHAAIRWYKLKKKDDDIRIMSNMN